MHPQAYAAVQRLRPPSVTHVYEVGSLNINGTVRPVFPDAVWYHGIDVVPGPGVDAVADAETYIPPLVPDCIVCCEVLEHAPRAEALLRRLGALVAHGGQVIVTCAGPDRRPHSGVDGGDLRDGEFYRNLSAAQLAAWLQAAGLTRVRVEQAPGVPQALANSLLTAGDLYAVGYK